MANYYYSIDSSRWSIFEKMFAENDAKEAAMEAKMVTTQMKRLHEWLLSNKSNHPDWMGKYQEWTDMVRQSLRAKENPQVDETWGPVSP